MSTLLRGGNTADPKKGPFVFASAHQEEQNATYEKSTKDTSLLAIIIIGVFAVFASIGAITYLRKRKNDLEEDEWNNNLDAVVDEEVKLSSSYDEDIDMELPAGKSSDSRDSSAYLNTNDAAPVSNRLSNGSPNDAIEAEVSQGGKAASASSVDEAEQCCKPACFGWGDLESSLGFKSSTSPPSTAEVIVEHPFVPPTIDQMDEIEEESASNVASPPPGAEDASYTFFADPSREISAARMDPRTAESRSSKVQSEGSADDHEDHNLRIDNGSLSPRQQIPIGPDAMSGPFSYYMSDESEDEVGEFDEVSTDNGCSASEDSRLLFGDSSSTTRSNASEELNNQRHTPQPRMPIDNEMRKKFARRGLQTLQTVRSQGKN